MAKKIFTHNLSEPLHGLTNMQVEINTTDGNLIIDALPGGPELASGALQYLENQGQPTHTVESINGQNILKVRSGSKGQPWIRFPWAACNGATEWHIHLNPDVSMEINAISGGGNIQLDLTGLMVTNLNLNTGGGNIDVILPDHSVGICMSVKTGAGNVTVHIPKNISARITATTGIGKVITTPTFGQIDKSTYQSPDYDRAEKKVEITASSGAGNVVILEKTSLAEAAAVQF